MELARGFLSVEGSLDVFSLVEILEGDILPRDRSCKYLRTQIYGLTGSHTMVHSQELLRDCSRSLI